jgi:hypothetical protein
MAGRRIGSFCLRTLNTKLTSHVREICLNGSLSGTVLDTCVGNNTKSGKNSDDDNDDEEFDDGEGRKMCADMSVRPRRGGAANS